MNRRDDELAFVATLQAEKPKNPAHLTAMDAKRLMTLGRRYKRHAENLCNLPDYQETYDHATADVAERIMQVIKPYRVVKVLTGGDPRGCTVKLVLRSGRSNDFGGEGYCVPGA